MPKPASVPRWASTGAAVIEEPSSGVKDVGWVVEKPSYKIFNWAMNLAYQWLDFLNPLFTSGGGLSATADSTIAGSLTVNGTLIAGTGQAVNFNLASVVRMPEQRWTIDPSSAIVSSGTPTFDGNKWKIFWHRRREENQNHKS